MIGVVDDDVQTLPGLHVPAAVEGGGVSPQHNAGDTHSEVTQTTRTWSDRVTNLRYVEIVPSCLLSTKLNLIQKLYLICGMKD